MLNDEDIKNLNKLLHIMKNSNNTSVLEILYSGKHGWLVRTDDEEWHDGSAFKKQRLGSLCIDLIVDLVQKRLNSDA